MSQAPFRTLGAGDEGALDAFLVGHRATSMFLRSNARSAGLVDRDVPSSGTYVAAFEGDEIVGVVGHFWNGMLLPQAPPTLAETLARAAIAATGRAVVGISGALEQVEDAKRYLGIADRAASLDEPEGLFTLALPELQLPTAMASGALVGCVAEMRWLDRLAAWRVAYIAEALGQPITDETPGRATAELRRAIEQRSGFVVVSAVEPDVPLAYAGYNAELPDIALALKEHDEVVGVPHDRGIAAEGRPNISDEPFVEHLVQVDVREQGRDHPSLRRSLVGVREVLSLEHPGVQPLPDQALQHSVTYPLAEDFPESGVVDGVEELSNIDLDEPPTLHPPWRIPDRILDRGAETPSQVPG